MPTAMKAAPSRKKARHGAVGGEQIDVAKQRENQGVSTDDAQGNKIDDKQRQILSQHNLGGCDRKGIQKLVSFLPPLLGNGAHGQNGDDDDKDKAAEGKDKFKIAKGSLNIAEHCAKPTTASKKAPNT